MNKIILHGKITRDPEMQTVSGGIENCRFSVAVNRPVGKDKEPVADFIPCTAWRQTAAFVSKYFHKGDGIIVEGSLQTHSYEKNGEKRTAYDVNVERVEFAEKKDGRTAGAPTSAGNAFAEVEDAELPF